MQRGEDDLERAEVLELGVGVDRDAAPVVAHREPIAGLESDVDRAGMSGHGLIHRIVERLGGEVVQRRLVSPADIHAGAATHGLEPLEYLDVASGVIALPLRGGEGAEKIVHAVFPVLLRTLKTRSRTGKRFGL